jgi:hypothetical protein
MSRRAVRVLVFVLPVLAVLASACGSTVQPTDPTPPSPTAGLVAVTETFDSTLVSGGSNLHTFHAMPGLVKITLVSLDPAADAPVFGLGVGMWDGLSCQIVLDTPLGAPGAELIATASMDSQVCIKVWDLGTLSTDAALKYQVSAIHNEKPPS